MVIGLFGLALVMIVGGVASVVQGFPYVRLESGLAMVIGGASAASAGAILLGLAAAVARLKSLEQTILSARSGPAFGFPEPQREISVGPPSSAPLLAGTAGLAGVGLGRDGFADTREDGAGAPEVSAGPVDRFAPAPEAEPVLPNLLPPEHPTQPSVSAQAERQEPAFAPAEEAPPTSASAEPVPEQLSLRSSLADEAAVGPGPIEPPKPEVAEPQVVGTYASGGNTYVMYSNGSIEADTPKGRFTFDSLEELKAFVAAGGENGTRGAA